MIINSENVNNKLTMKEYYGYIYKITNLKNKKYYIGQKSGMFDPNYWGSSTNREFLNDFKRLGKKFFKREILYYAKSRQELDLKEIEFIGDKYINDRNCYNLSPGGYGWAQVNKMRTHEEFSRFGRMGYEKSRKSPKTLRLIEKRKNELIKRKNDYYKNPNKCCICGSCIEFEKKDNKTCSSKCYRKLASQNNKNKKLTEETKKKISESLTKNHKIKCIKCGNEISNKNKTKLCNSCYKEFKKFRLKYDIQEIKRMRFEEKMTYSEIAAMYGVSHPTISFICRMC